MANNKVYRVLPVPVSSLGEGPVWDAKTQHIYWLDILDGIIHRYQPYTQVYRHWRLPETMVGAVALCEENRLLAALHDGFAFFDLAKGAIKPIVDPESHLPDNRFNDGKCDPSGRFWAGTMALSEKNGAGSLYGLDQDLTCTPKLSGVSISNGLAWTADGQTMYYIDTPTLSVFAFDFELVSGTISNRRTVIDISEAEGFPDGMTIDREGKLWVAHWDGGQVARWDPLSGKKLLSYALPAARITSCTFGGENLQDLYITSARVGLSTTELQEQPLAGSLFVIKNCGYQGYPSTRFKFNH